MRVFKTRLFNRWASNEKVTDDVLVNAVNEMERGLVDANLGGQVYKKRIAIQGRGKWGGVRTIIAYRVEDRAFFIYGFAKNDRANVNAEELKAFKILAGDMLGSNEAQLEKMVNEGKLFEVMINE